MRISVHKTLIILLICGFAAVSLVFLAQAADDGRLKDLSWRQSEQYEGLEYRYTVYEGTSNVSEQSLVITAIRQPSNLFFASLQDLSNKSHTSIISFIFNQEGRTYPSSLVNLSKDSYPEQKILSSMLRLPPEFLLEDLSTDIAKAPSGEDSMLPLIPEPENEKNMIYFSYTGGLPFCLNVPEKHKIEKINSATRITLKKISKTLAGDELVSYKYTFMENLRTTSEEIG